MQELYDKLSAILTGTFGVPAEEISPEATFEALGLDSLDLVEVTLVVEEELGVRIPDEDLESIITVQDAVTKVADELKVSA